MSKCPEGTAIDVSLWHPTEDGWERDYKVTEKVVEKAVDSPPPPVKAWPTNLADLIASRPPDFSEWECQARLPTLRIDIESIEVHVVKGVTFDTTRHLVSRERRENEPEPF